MSLGKGRPRKLAVVQELNGAFDKNPQRRRYDPEPTAPLDPTPPPELAPNVVAKWNDLIDRMPNIVVTNADREGLKTLALSLVAMDAAIEKWDINAFAKAEAIARNWLIHFGMTPLARTKFATKEPPSGKHGNPFKKI